MWDGKKNVNVFYLTTRKINNPLTPEWVRVMGRHTLNHIWNMYRGDAVNVLEDSKRWIKKRGTGRQRDEGIKLIERVQRRLREWVYDGTDGQANAGEQGQADSK